MLRRLVPTVLLLAAAFPAGAALNVVATTSSMGMLARTVGGDAVKVTVLAPPDRDAHTLTAKPSMMIALRRADLLVAVGAELEVGWLPAALEGSANPRIRPGQRGYLEGAAQIDLIEKGQAADRSKGDVHPAGNPHFYLDPRRMATIAGALAARLGELDPPGAARYRAAAETFAKDVDARVPRWRASAQGVPGVVLYHKDVNYLTELLGVPVLGYVEPIPGIPATAAHLAELVSGLRGKRGVILYNVFQSPDGPALLAKNLGWKTVRLPLEVALDGGALDYFALLDQWVAALSP